MSTALITGANGFVGSHMAEYLLEKGLTVRCLVRKTSDLANLRGLKVDYFYADITKQDSLDEALRGVDYVFHFAGRTKARTEAEYMKANAFGVGALAEACLNFPQIKMLVYCSSLAAVGPQQGPDPVDENLKPSPISAYGRSKLEGEEILRKICGDKILYAIVRPTGIYGPRDTEIYIYFKTVCRGLKIGLSGKKRKFSLIHVRDLVHLCWLAATKSPSGEVYMASDGEAYTWEELSDMIEKALMKRAVKIKIPICLTGLLARLSEMWGNLKGEVVTLNREKMRELRAKGWVVSIKKARTTLGFKPEYTAERGIAETTQWYIHNGWL